MQFNFASDIITADTTIYAKWKINTYNVTFETNGGSTVASQTIDYNSVATVPYDPTKVGYSFDGWCKDESLTTPFAFTTEKIIADTTIYAKWVITYDYLTFTFIDSSNSAYSVAKKSGATLPNVIVLPAEYNKKPVVAIGNSAFIECSSLTSVTIPASVTTIGEYAFGGCSGLTSVAIPASVISIGNSAFVYCSSLNSVKFETVSKLTSIGNRAFQSCGNLVSITLPSSVANIGSSAFENCDKLTSINVDDGNANFKSIDGNLYSKDGATLLQYAIGKTATAFTILTGVARIGSLAFYGCSRLTSVTISASVASIGDDAFYNCIKLAKIQVDSSNANFKSVDGNLYSKDGSILVKYCATETATTPTIPASVTTISAGAVAYCRNLTNIIFENGSKLISIGSRAFENCDSLKSITIPASVTNIGSSAFRGCNSLANIAVDSNNANFKSVDGNLYSKNGSELIQYAVGKTSTNFTIPAEVTIIGSNAFFGCISLTSITISSSVTTIASDAFWCCGSLTSVTFEAGSKLTTIDSNAFSGCIKLTSITIPISVTNIGEYAFRGCSSLTIYAEVASKPAGWSNSWNSSGCPVVWGHKR